MKWYRNLKIGVKIVSGFLIIALIVAAVGVFGLISLETVNTKTDKMYTENTMAIEKLSQIAQLYQRTRVIVRDIILIDDMERKQGEVENLANRSDTIMAAVQELKGFIGDDNLVM